MTDGHAVVTGAGNLPCKRIIHAVGPRWKGGFKREESILYNCVLNHILPIAENFTSIAIPAISSGIFGFPIHVSPCTIVRAVKDFLGVRTGTGSLKEIHLVDNMQDGAQAFAAALTETFSDESLQIEPRYKLIPSLMETVPMEKEATPETTGQFEN